MQHAGNSRNTKALAALMTPLSLLMLAIQFNVSAPVAAQTPSANAPNSSTSGPAYPLKLSANRRYLVDRNNQPFLIVGDTPQGLMGRLSEADADFYFADRQAHGFNTVGWIDVTCAGPDYPTNTEATTPDGLRPFNGFLPGGTDFKHYDFSKPNEAYFTRLDHMITLAEKHGILVFLDPMETIGWLPALRNNGAAADYAYGQYLGNRYKEFPNIAWLNGNDFNTWKDPKAERVNEFETGGVRV